MKKRNLVVMATMIATMAFGGVTASAYELNTDYQLGMNEGSPYLANRKYIIIHETANPKATGKNEAIYMNRNWRNSYTTHIVGDGKVYQIGEPGYISYGAGNANIDAPVQIELQHTKDRNLFSKNYEIYVELIREMANKYNIPLTLDNGSAGVVGIKSHLWVTQNIWGDHTDPYGYLSSMGVSKAKLANDIKNGISGSNYHKESGRYYDITEDSSAIYKSANFNEKYYGTFAKGSQIWISEVKEVSKGVFMGKNPAGWLSLNKDYMN